MKGAEKFVTSNNVLRIKGKFGRSIELHRNYGNRCLMIWGRHIEAEYITRIADWFREQWPELFLPKDENRFKNCSVDHLKGYIEQLEEHHEKQLRLKQDDWIEECKESERLQEELKTQNEKIEKLTKCAEFYASPDYWLYDSLTRQNVVMSKIDRSKANEFTGVESGGKLARQTLKEIKEQGE